MSKTIVVPQRHPSARLDSMSAAEPDDLPPLAAPVVRGRAGGLPPGMFEGLGATPLPLEASRAVREGRRNDYLIRMAGRLRRHGVGGDALLAELLSINDDRCIPPLDESEVEGIAESAERWPAGAGSSAAGSEPVVDEAPLDRGDEVEVARRLLDELPQPMVGDRGKLWTYSERGVFVPHDAQEIARSAARWSGHPVRAGTDRDGNPKYKPLNISNRFALGVTDIALREHREMGFFDEEVPGIAFTNGFFGVDGLVAHSPDHRARMAVGFDYEADSMPARFIEYLGGCFRDQGDRDGLIQLIRQIIGVFAFGLATTYQRAFILLGPGANGKSVLLSVIRSMFPDHECVTATKPQDWGREYSTARLANSRVNIVSELPEVVIMASEAVKGVITGDLIEAREIYRRPFSFAPRAGHLFSTNSLPGVRDHSLGFWRRWAVIPFERTFRREEQDRHLTDKLVEERAAILSWAADAVPGVVDAGGYAIPASCDAATAKWQESADQIACFLADDDDMAAGGWKLGAAQIYERFRLWAVSSGYRYPVTNRVFWARLAQSRGVHAYKSNGRRMFKSLKPKEA